MSGRQRIDGQVAYILHSYAYSETSLILDVFARDYGRLPLLARGARRPRSALRGVLQAFQPLELGWFGAGEVRTLARAEWLGGMPMLGGTGLMLGYYLNELLMKLLPREDAHAVLFEAYATTLHTLSHGSTSSAACLRQFEKALLRELGYGIALEREAVSGEAVL
ncbi:MAG: DNA repair protein RecO, partial [Proteobacteria bacterium]|nr:DNA repair protein RecO [Pseudomonadota bacterium]